MTYFIDNAICYRLKMIILQLSTKLELQFTIHLRENFIHELRPTCSIALHRTKVTTVFVTAITS